MKPGLIMSFTLVCNEWCHVIRSSGLFSLTSCSHHQWVWLTDNRGSLYIFSFPFFLLFVRVETVIYFSNYSWGTHLSWTISSHLWHNNWCIALFFIVRTWNMLKENTFMPSPIFIVFSLPPFGWRGSVARLFQTTSDTNLIKELPVLSSLSLTGPILSFLTG